MALKDERIIYVARNFTAGLADVTAVIRRNGVQVATGAALSDIGSGRYELLLTPATVTGYGGAGYYDFYINSATPSKNAPAISGRHILVNDTDDLETHLGSIETKIDTIDGEVGAVQVDLTSVKATVENSNTVLNDGTIGNANLKSILDTVQSVVTNISNVVRFNSTLLPTLIRKGVGSKAYRVDVFVYDNAGNMEDVDNNQIQLSLANASGIVRDSLITGFAAQPHYITRIAAGHYQFDLTIPDTAALEPIVAKYNYLEATVPLIHFSNTEVVTEAQATGFALETTSQEILTDTADIQPKVVTMLGILQDVSFGNSALKDLLAIIDGNTDGIEASLADATSGLPALRTQIDLKASQSSVNVVQAGVDNIKGAGFVEADDSLEAISDRIYYGGTSI